ncbi:hypothetical protein PMI30_03056 [Pseudomonas sp. GM50]|nr:hypothetical protein PMI30_03056 [Pseudomonas sp. GM50]
MPAKALLRAPSPASLAPTSLGPIGGFFLAKFQAKKASNYAGLSFRGESGSVCGHFGIMGDQRNQSVLLTVGELAEALQQFAFMQ